MTTLKNIPADFAARKFERTSPAANGTMYGDVPLYYYAESTTLALAALEVGETHVENRADGKHTFTRVADDVQANTIDTVAAGIGWTKPAKRMLTRDQQIAKLTKWRDSFLLTAKMAAQDARGGYDFALKHFAPGTKPFSESTARAERHAKTCGQALMSADLYQRLLDGALADNESTTYEDN